MLRQGIDTVVLGCTHYPFVIPMIKQIVGPKVRVIDPAPAVARQATRLLKLKDQFDNSQAGISYYTSGDVEKFQALLPVLMSESGKGNKLTWEGNKIVHFGDRSAPSVP